MKKSIFSRFLRKKASKRQPDKPVATPADLQKKLASYQRVEGPAIFTPAAVYFVNEVDEEESRLSAKDPKEFSHRNENQTEHQDS